MKISTWETADYLTQPSVKHEKGLFAIQWYKVAKFNGNGKNLIK